MDASVQASDRSMTGDRAANRLGQVSWAMFEWARNPYVILITIYIFAPYFTNVVVGDPVKGQALIGTIAGYAGLVIALLAPILGAIADSGGRRKPWIVVWICVLAPCAWSLWYALPAGQGGSPIWLISSALLVAAVMFEFTQPFHNAMLPSIAQPERVGPLSGLGLALGNAASVLILCFMLITLTLPGQVDWSFVPSHAWFGLDQARYENSRIAGPVAAVWLILFSLPLLLFTPDRAATSQSLLSSISTGFHSVVRTVRSLCVYRNVGLYLLARMIYNDGKTAVLVFGGVYAAGNFGWQALALYAFGIALSTFAVAGGFLGGWLDNRFGSKRAILISIGGTMLGLFLELSITPKMLFFMPYDFAHAAKIWRLPFFATLPELAYVSVATLVAVFITAAYANSRTMLARIAPMKKMTEFFGIYSLSGYATTFISSFTVAFFTTSFTSLRAGYASILIFLGIGFLLMFFVREERATDV
jgi:MFS transporter, UMF1 family